MSKMLHLEEDSAPSILSGAGVPLTALARTRSAHSGAAPLTEARGAQMLSFFSDAEQELLALTTTAGVFDQGARVRLRITGEDRVRWLNGMVTNTVKALAPGIHNYTFVLNAQGRIQGDATVFAFEDQLILETDRVQAEHLHAHLDRFIIMDDVELGWVEGQTSLGLAGPSAASILAALDLPVPDTNHFIATDALELVCEHRAGVPRYSLWLSDARVASLWNQLAAAGAIPCGAQAVEALRVIEGTPLYGPDITEKTLAQETGQMHALNFNKGCYLGQEIVERIRSRATVHRGLRQFALTGATAVVGAPLKAGEAAVGELTSIAPVLLPGQSGQVAIGLVRLEVLERAEKLNYPGGEALLFARPFIQHLGA